MTATARRATYAACCRARPTRPLSVRRQPTPKMGSAPTSSAGKCKEREDKKMKSRQNGFTLVEIAIVLVIIGLLLGGILKGQEMITQAKIKNVIADFSGVSAAYYGYQDRYRAIPGDDSGALARWATAAPAPVSGNGNGLVQGTW